MTRQTPWLSDREQRVWRGWLAVNAQLPAALHRELQADAGLSLPDFDVLVQLTDDAEGRVRVTDLARALGWERSRVSHHVTRMEGRGLVRREDCRDDARGAYVVLTPEGRAAIGRAAPGHVRTVRSLLFDHLSEHELQVLARVLDNLSTRLDQQVPARTTR
jgi:DNA-binding MarR family transcriptional regulator